MAKDICPVCNRESKIRSSISSNGINDSYTISIYDCCHAQLKLYKKSKNPVVEQVEVSNIKDTKLVETLLFNKVYGIRVDKIF